MTIPAKRPALGQGLNALLPPAVKADGGRETTRELPITQLKPNRFQPRKKFDPIALAELTQSLKESGMIQPIIVRPGANGQFEIIAGERRWRAAQQAGLGKVPVVVREISDEKALEWALIENLQREDLNAIEEAEAIAELIEKFSLSQEQAAERIGKERSTVANLLRLLKLAPKTRALVIEGKLSGGHARPLLALEGHAQEALAQTVVARGLSVRETEKAVRHALAAPRTPRPARDADTRAAETALYRALGCQVFIHPAKKGGNITIKYASLDEFNRIYEKLTG